MSTTEASKALDAQISTGGQVVAAASTQTAAKCTSSFSVSPQEIIFRSFKPNKTYEATITFKNQSKQSEYIRVARVTSQVFSLTAPKSAEGSLKVASGLTVSYKVRFTPESNKDYSCVLRVLTDNGEMSVPLVAHADRGSLVLPAQFTTNPCPVKASESTTLFLRNDEPGECIWKASVDAPFAISPSSGVVPGNGGLLPVDVLFSPRQCREYHSTIRFFLGLGGDMVQEVPVTGNGFETSIQMEPHDLEFVDTYVTRERQAIIQVANNSDHTAHFSWKNDYEDTATMDMESESESRLTEAYMDSVFSIEPASGIIYGRGVREFTVTFNPQLAVLSGSTAYLDISGKCRRLPLSIAGRGVGPQCRLEFTRLNIGDIFMNELHEYEINIENIGCVEAVFTVLPPTSLMGRKFTFTPSSGVLAPSESTLLKVQLQSDLIGAINEIFPIHLHGATNDLTAQFKGRILGPTYHFDIHELDFGNVSYNFWHSRTFYISNTSRIPMKFSLHLPEESEFIDEFKIIPAEGTIPAKHAQIVQVDFLSNTVGEYDTAIVMDMEDVGDEIDCLPLKALCMVPPLYLVSDTISYGRCFVGYEYVMNLEVANDTPMSGKFEISILDADSLKEKALVHIGDPNRDTTIDILEAHSRMQVPITLRTIDIGSINFSLSIKVLGSTTESQTALVSAVSRGPFLELMPAMANFGKIPVLQTVEKILTFTNTSPIEAVVGIALTKSRNDGKSFHVEPTSATIEPYGKLPVKVTAFLDEAMTFKDTIEVDVKYSPNSIAPIQVRAIGEGFALVPNIDLTDFNFGDVFTDFNVSQELILHNHGRRTQEIQWLNVRGTKVKEGAPPIVFKIQPERVSIAARTSCTFYITGISEKVGTMTDNFYVKQSGSAAEILRAKVSGNFIAPLIAYSNKSVAFEFIQGKNDIHATQTKTFTMKNMTSKELVVMLKIQEHRSPFSIEEPYRFTLASEETHVVGVTLNPAYRGDWQTHTAKSKLVVAFADRTQTETVSLTAKLMFPSIRVEPEGEVNFGTIMKDTEIRTELVLHNESAIIPAKFSWKLLNGADEAEETGSNRSNSVQSVTGTDNVLTKMFDFIPFKGTIPPGGMQRVEAVFYGASGEHETNAICAVEGGPSSSVKMMGAAGEVQIHYDRTSLDFGVIPYYSSVTKTITISNPSHVSVNYVTTFSLKNPNCLKITPMSGKIKDKLRIQITFTPTVPDEIQETFSIHVGHFDPQVVKVIGRGQVNTLIVLPTDNNATVTRIKNETFEMLTTELRSWDSQKLIPYITKTASLALPPCLDALTQEVERQAFCAAVYDFQNKHKGASHDASSPDNRVQMLDRLIVSDSETYPLRRQMRRSSNSAKGSVKHVLSRYILDFGHMTRSEKRSTKVKLMNTCSENLFLILDSKEFMKTPLTIEPLKVTKIPPLDSFMLDVTLDASHNLHVEDCIVPGENVFEFTVDIKEGPVVVIECRCYIATPLLKVSDNLLDFGELLTGHARIVPLTLYNEQAVPCEWRLSCRESKANVPEGLMELVTQSPQFWVNMDHGILPPNESLTLEVYYAPVISGNASASLVFRFVNNNKGVEVKLKGVGREVNVALSPVPFEIPVVRPVQVSHQTMRITNNEENPVLVYACGLDPLTHYEFQLMEWCLSMVDGGRIIFPLRVAGSGVHNDILEYIYALMNESQGRLKYVNDDGQRQGSPKNMAPSRSEIASRQSEVEEDPALPENPALQPYMVLLLGPPQSGKTTQAEHLQSELGFEMVNFNSLIEEEAEKDSAMGEVIRNIMSLLPTPSIATEHNPTETFGETNPTLHLQEAQLFTSTFNRTNLSNPFEATSYKESAAPSILMGTIPTSSRGGRKQDPPAPVDPIQSYQFLIPSMLRQLLRMFVRRASARQTPGYIMDDVTCCLSQDKVLLLRAVQELCTSMAIPLHIITLGVSEATVGLRYASTVFDHCQEYVREARIEPLPEDDYAALTAEERYEYNFKLKHLNECRRNLKEAGKKMEHFQKTLVEEPHLSIPHEVQEKHAAAMMSVTSKPGKKARQSIASQMLQQAAPQWKSLSPLIAFKELYGHLVKCGEEEGILPEMMHYVPAEQSVEHILETIVDTLLQNKRDAEDMMNHEEEKFSSRHSTVRSFGENDSKSRFGEWQYIDAPRLRAMMNRRSGDYIRFFSMVEREVLVVKKNAKNKQGTTTLLHHNEELSRWCIPARSYVDVNVEFCSDQIGRFSVTCPFGVTGCAQTLELNVLAQVALPDMGRDDKDIFPVTRQRLVAGRLPGKVFVASKRTYDFGPLLVPGPVGGKTRVKGAKERPASGTKSLLPAFPFPEEPKNSTAEVTLGATEVLTFSNSGISPADVQLSFMNDKEKTFTVNPSRFTLDVGGSQEVVLRAAPEIVGEIQNRLIATVKDNPNPWQVSVSCAGSKPSLTIDGQKEAEIDFGRSVINRSDQRTLTLANASRMAIQWRIAGVEKMPHDITINETSGIIEENGTYPIHIVFAPTNTCLHTTPLLIFVTDPNVSSIVYEAIPIVIKAEGHDVVLEWTREVDFKLMHVGETKKELIRVMNKSPYDVSYMFRLPQRLQNFISVSPQSGTIRGMMGYKDSAISTVEVTAHFDREGEIPKRLAQLEATFFDNQQQELLYPVQIIPLKGEAWFTKFSVKPDNIDFGSCFYNQKKQSTLEVRNTGRFPVNFVLFDFNEGCKELTAKAQATAKLEGTEEAPAPTKKPTKGKHHDTDFRIGCFTVSPARGTVQVGEVQTLTVYTSPQPESRTKETLGVFVEKSGPELEAHGLPIELSAQPATPGITADLSSPSDVETIFEEQQVLFRLDQFGKSAKAFGREDKAFSFGTVLVGHESEERFRIANSSPLPCHVMVQLQSLNSSAKAVIVPDCFRIRSEKLVTDKGQDVLRFTLPPFESRFVSTVFAPSALQRYEARFVAIVENGTDPRTNNLTFNLIGVGTLPNVEFILPPSLNKMAASFGEASPRSSSQRVKSKEGNKKPAAVVAAPVQNDTIEMPLTRVGATASRFFTIRNIGRVPANIRVTLISDEYQAAGLTVMKRNVNITISVGAEEHFEVLYSPSTEGKGFMRLQVSLADNPFEDKELIVEAQSFYQDISFDSIDPATSDCLNVGDCFLNDPKTVTFGMRNNTGKDIRFSWLYPPVAGNVMQIVPQEGHLRAHQSKQMSVTVEANKLEQNRILTCEVQGCPIDIIENVDWDSSMSNQKWVVVEDENSKSAAEGGRRNLRRIKEPVPEPSYRLLNDTLITQPFNIGYTCDKPNCDVTLLNTDGRTLPLEAISFPKTKIFQRRIATLQIKNTGNVFLPYEFSVEPRPNTSRADAAVNPECEFSVERPEGTVKVGHTEDVHVVFAPSSAETVSATLFCRFPHSDRKPLQIPLTGLGECPLVHFNLPSSEYLANRVDGEAGAIIDPETVIIEFLTRGLHSRVAVKFKVINPTTSNHQFEWLENSDPETLSPFRCLTPSGSISAGKQLEMAFEFSANTLGLRECRWSFMISGKASVPFLLVGRAVEPDVFFSNSKINFGSVSLGSKSDTEIVLENRDDAPFGFCFDKAVLATTPFLSVKPSHGTIGPKDKLPITITFTPKDEQEYNMPLVCAVKKASTPLTVNVKGEGFTIHETLVLEQPGEEEPIVAQRSQPMQINLGRVQLYDTVTRRFTLTNTGIYSFEYTVSLPNRQFLKLDNLAGTVRPKQSTLFTLTYNPTAEENLRACRLQFNISEKIVYQVSVQAVSYIPRLNLSFEKYDFGPRFVKAFNSGAVISTLLSIFNADKEMVTLDASLSDGNDWCDLDVTSVVIRPNDSKEITITFNPTETRIYDDRLKFLVNGVYPIFVPISGEGVTPRVEVLNHFCKLGVGRIGEKREAEMRLECRSRIPTPISFVGCLDEDLTSKGVSLVGGLTYILKPREVRTIHVLFHPQRRMGAFQREMKMLVCDREVPFALITGACEDSEIHLDNSTLKFSDVVAGSSSVKKLIIMNSGDISQKFAWNTRAAGAEIAVTPSSGFVRSHTEYICEFKYMPSKAETVLQKSVTVEFDNSPPITVVLEGNSIARPPAKGVLQFRCRARERHELKLTVENSASQPWSFSPKVDHASFIVPPNVTIKSRGRTDIPVVYAPMKTTVGGEPDECTLFIPHADGTGQTYILEGIADEPGAAGPLVEIALEAKVLGQAKFIVKNWYTKSALRFTRDITWVVEPPEGLITIKGQSGVDVPPESSKEYVLSLQGMGEGFYRGTIHFQCGERPDLTQFYDFVLKIASQPTTETLKLESMVRTSAIHKIPVLNPLAKSVTVTCKLEGSSEAITVPPTLVVPAKSESVIPIEFFPLVHKEYNQLKVVVNSVDLGMTTYLVKPVSTPPPPEKITRLVCPLGQSVTFGLRFVHFTKNNTDFSVAFVGDNAPTGKGAVFTKVGTGTSIKAQATTRPQGQELLTEFIYEPQMKGNMKEVIEFTSPVGGTYTFPIAASCVDPQRQGPFTMRPGQNTAVPFKNVFAEAVSINATTDSPNFVVTKKSESVAAKKTVNITVQCKSDDPRTVVRGKLLISCTPPGEKKPLEWVYYLEGGCDTTAMSSRRSLSKGSASKKKGSPPHSRGK